MRTLQSLDLISPKRAGTHLELVAVILCLLICPFVTNSLAFPAPPRSAQAPNPQTGSDLLEPIQEVFDRGEFEEAAKLLRGLLTRAPDNAPAFYLLVRALLLQDLLDEASGAVANLAGPESAWLRLARADLAYRLGNFEAAEVQYRLAIQRDNSLARAHLGLGGLFKSERRLASAKEQLKTAFALDPDDPEIVLAWSKLQPRSVENGLLERYLDLKGYKPDVETKWVRTHLDLHKALGDAQTFELVDRPESATLDLEPVVDHKERDRAFRNRQPIPVRGFSLRVSFNGGSKRRLLLDTGANGIILSSKLAEKDGIRPLAESSLGGVGTEGRRAGSVALAEKASIGGLEFRNCLVRTIDKKHLRGVDGIIGADVFWEFLIKLDLPGRKVELTRYPEGPCAGSCYDRDWIPTGEAAQYPRFRLISGKILVPARIDDSITGQILIDTGANLNFLSTRVAKTLGSGSSTHGEVRGLSGAVASLSLLPKATIAMIGVRQVNLDLYAFDLTPTSHAIGVELVGLAGHPMLQYLALTIDYRSGWINVEVP